MTKRWIIKGVGRDLVWKVQYFQHRDKIKVRTESMCSELARRVTLCGPLHLKYRCFLKHNVKTLVHLRKHQKCERKLENIIVTSPEVVFVCLLKFEWCWPGYECSFHRYSVVTFQNLNYCCATGFTITCFAWAHARTVPKNLIMNMKKNLVWSQSKETYPHLSA